MGSEIRNSKPVDQFVFHMPEGQNTNEKRYKPLMLLPGVANCPLDAIDRICTRIY